MTDIEDYLIRRVDRMTFGILTDPKNPAPVIPADLHLVKPPEVAADGTVACMRCGTRVAYGAAVMVGSEGMSCTRCARPRREVLAVDTPIRRRVWPAFAVGAVVVLVGIYGIWHHELTMDRAEYERQYPIASHPGDNELIATAVTKWRLDTVVAAMTSPPALSTIHLGAAACPADDVAHALEFRAGDGDTMKQQLSFDLASVKRGRYYAEDERTRAFRHLAGPILIVAIAEQEAPTINKPESGSAEMTYDGGFRTGTAYLYDVDGTLRCAGSFEAESSEVVKYTWMKSDDLRIASDKRLEAKHAIAGDLADKTTDAIHAALRRVE